MADSSLAVTGGNVDTRTASNGDHRAVVALGDSVADTAALVNADNELFVRAGQRPSDLGITATGVAAAAVTLTLPAPATGLFHYITMLEITAYTTVARAGSATPVLVTSTNLPNSPVWTFASVGAVGTVDRIILPLNSPLKANTAATATTIVAPATTSVIWRINTRYYVSQ